MRKRDLLQHLRHIGLLLEAPTRHSLPTTSAHALQPEAFIKWHIRHIGAFNGQKQSLLVQNFIVLQVMQQRWRHSIDDHAHEYRRARHACRSEEHTSELQSLMRSSYAVFCLK